MLIKRANLKIEASSVIDRDILLRGPQKTAFIKHDIGKNLIHASNSLDVLGEIKERNPEEWVIFRARAIDAGGSEKNGKIYHGANDNGDYFSEEELLAEAGSGIKSFETFINCPIFCNHENGDIEKARGKIVSSFYDLDNHCVYTDAMVDGKAYPALARGIREGYITDVSMGKMKDSSRVLMADGSWKRHDEIVPGDCVITHTGKIQPITMIARTNEKTESYEINFIGQDNPIIASYDHPVLTIKKDQVGCIFTFDKKSKCTPKGIENNLQCKKRNCDFSKGKTDKDFYPDFVEVKDLEVGDYLLTPIDKWVDIENKNADLDFSSILGYYLAEGNLHSKTGIYFNFHIKETKLHKDLINSIKSFCNRQGFPFRIGYRIDEKVNRYQIEVFCRELVNLIGEYSSGTSIRHDKKIKSKDVFKWNKEAKLNLIAKVIDGDGCNIKTKKGNGNGLKFYSNSEPLTDDINNLCLSCGIISRKSSILRDKYSDSSLVKSIPNEEFNVSIGNFDAECLEPFCDKYQQKTKTKTMLSNRRFIWNGYLCSPIKEISKRDYDNKEFFYHIEVGGNENPKVNEKSDHSYIADGVSVHNCSIKYSNCSICGRKAHTESEYCLVPGTKITLGDYTLKNIEDIEKDDLVLTHDGSIGKVEEIMDREINEDIRNIYVSGSNIPLRITYNHPVLVLKKMKYRETFEKYYKNNFELEWEKAEDIEIGDYLVSPKYQINQENPVSNSFSRLAGIYLAEGNIFRQKYKNGKKIDGIEFSIGLHEEELKSNIMDLCKTVTGKEAKCYENGHSYHIRICDREFGEKIYSIFGEYSKCKNFGSEFYGWSLDNIKEFLGGYIDGDGYYDKTNNRNYIRTSSLEIAIQMQKILSLFDSWGTLFESINSENSVVKYVNKENDRLTYLVTIPNINYDKIISNNCIKTRDFIKTSSFDTKSHWVMNNYDIVKVRGIVEENYTGTVFNFSVEGNNDYIANNLVVHNCDHIKNSKGRKIAGKEVYEINHGIKFIELSAVTDGACENCTVQNVYTGNEFLEKLQDVVKIGNTQLSEMSKSASFNKEARGEDVDSLNQALDLLKKVADQILNSKDVDYEFLEEIGGLLSELQNLIVDLVEAGFANQNSNQPEESNEEINSQGDNTSEMSPELPSENQNGGMTSPPPVSPTLPNQGQQAPVAATSNNKFNKISKNLKGLGDIRSELSKLVASVYNLKENLEGEDGMATAKERARIATSNKINNKFSEIIQAQIENNEPIVIKSGIYSTTIDMNKGIKGFIKEKEVATFSNEELGEEIVTALQQTPELVANSLIEQLKNKYNSNGEVKMGSKNTEIKKEALLTNAPPVDEVGEGQLDNMSGNFDRKWNGSEKAEGQLGVTTESQLDNIPQSSETGKGDFNRVRPNDGKTENLEVTEGQLDISRPTNWGSEREQSDKAETIGQHKGIQEWQLAQSGFGSERWDNDLRDGEKLPITENQFEGKDRSGEAIDEVSEGQIEGHRQGKDYSGKVIEAFVDGLANAVVYAKVSPKTIASVVPTVNGILENKNPQIITASSNKKTRNDIQSIAEKSISNSIGINKDLATPYLSDIISVIYENRNGLMSEISKMATKKINELNKVALSEIEDNTVEEDVKLSVISAWNKRFDKKALLSASHQFIINAVEDLGFDTEDQLNSEIGIGKIKELVSKKLNCDPSKIATPQVTYDPKSKIATIDVYIKENGQNKEETSPVNNINDMHHQDQMRMHENISDYSNEFNEDEYANEPEGVEVAASAKAQLKKSAQSPGGTTMPPAGGQASPQMAPPAGGVESLSNTPPMEDEGIDDMGMGDEEMDNIEETKESMPFGAVSPVSGSDDVDIIDGHYRDNTNGIEYEVEVNYRILNPEKMEVGFQSEEETEEENLEPDAENDMMNEEINASPVSMQSPAPAAPAGGAAQGGANPMASAPKWVKEAAYRFAGMKISPELFTSVSTTIGQHCPSCSSKRVAFSNSEGICSTCGTKYFVALAKHEDGDILADMYVDPNLTTKRNKAGELQKNEFGGYAFAGTPANKEEIEAAIHQILSSKSAMVKVASSAKDGWIACINDQASKGFDGEDTLTICSSIKDFFLKKAEKDEDDEDEDDETSFEEDIDNEEDNTEFENEDNSEDIEDDGFEEMTEDEDSEDEDSEDEGFVSDGFEEVDESKESDDFENESEEDDLKQEVEIDQIEAVTLEGTDVEGEPFEVRIPIGEGDIEEVNEDIIGEDIEGEDIEGEDMGSEFEPEIEIEETFEGEPEDVSELLKEDKGLESAPEENGMADKDVLKGIFSGPEDDFEDEEEEEEEEEEDGEFGFGKGKRRFIDESEVKSLASKTTELLRNGLVGRASNKGGSTLDIEKLAQMLQMPLDTKVKVPRNKEDGIREDGIVAHTDDNDNTAKKMEGNAAGSTVADDDVVQSEDGKVEIIKPKASKDNWIKASTQKKAQQESANQTEPIDAISEEKEEENGEDINIPRDESKAKPEIDVKRPDVNNPKEVRKENYEMGQGGKDIHTEVVPRDKSGDGLGGKSVTFTEEKGDKATSGDPDNYVQKFQKDNQIAPTPAGNKDNHAVASVEKAITKLASSRGLKKENLEGYMFDDVIVITDITTGNIYQSKK